MQGARTSLPFIKQYNLVPVKTRRQTDSTHDAMALCPWSRLWQVSGWRLQKWRSVQSYGPYVLGGTLFFNY